MNLEKLMVDIEKRPTPTVAVPLANDPEIIGCVAEAIKLDLARFILIGDKDKILGVAESEEVDVSSSEFVAETDPELACDMAATLVQEGRAQVLMKGQVQTSTFSKAFLKKEHKLIPPDRLVSHVAMFEVPNYHKLLIITDAALNIHPELEAKAKIIKNALFFAKRLGIERPKVACVTPIEKVNPRIQSTVDAAELKRRSDEGYFLPGIVDGPFGMDVAVSKEAAEIKKVESEVAGDPDILLFPNISAANVCYKTLTQFANSRPASVIAGAKVPIVLTSRSDSEESKLFSLSVATRLA